MTKLRSYTPSYLFMFKDQYIREILWKSNFGHGLSVGVGEYHWDAGQAPGLFVLLGSFAFYIFFLKALGYRHWPSTAAA